MELKTNYQYTYFIHPFIIKEERYQKYLLKLLKDKNCFLKIFKKQEDLNLYKYFLPDIRKFLFSSFDLNYSGLESLKKMPIDTQSAILAKNPCTMFEYKVEKSIQGKAGEEQGIFFNISNIDIICFNSGICFLCIKTSILNSDKFNDLLNFNYKFRDINQEFKTRQYDRIKIQTNTFDDVKEMSELIKEITGPNSDAVRFGIDTERFFTYSYACLDKDYWNEYRKFENIENDFIKFTNVLPADNMTNFVRDESVTISEWKYAKIGLTKQAVTLFASAKEMNNFTILKDEFEREYFYTYILNLYKKIYLKKITVELGNSKKINATRKRFIEFTKKIWIQELTENEAGTIINQRLNEVFELDMLYAYTKNKYDVLYNDLKIGKGSGLVIALLVTVFVAIVLNIVNFIQLFSK
ncbi:MAG: hypothetical protein IJH76_00780 [Clostridia bacterium]|nr:hypothetical protein [Clostridia bacterium]